MKNKITIENIFNGEITNNLENYLTDHFIFRDTFRSIKTIFNLKIFNKKDNNNLYYQNNHIFKIEYPLKEDKVYNFTNKINTIYKNHLTNMNVYLSIIPDKNYYSENEYLKLELFRAEGALNDAGNILNISNMPAYSWCYAVLRK